METKLIERVINIIQHMENLIDDENYCIISESRRCIELLKQCLKKKSKNHGNSSLFIKRK